MNVVGAVTQRRMTLAAAAVLGEGKLVELGAFTGGTGVVPSAGPPRKTKARARQAAERDDEQVDGDEDEDETDSISPRRGAVAADRAGSASGPRHGRRRRPRDYSEPGAQPGARHRDAQVLDRAGRDRRDLPPPRPQPRSAPSGRDCSSGVRGTSPARGRRPGSPARRHRRQGCGPVGPRARPPQDPRLPRRAARGARGHPAPTRRTAARPIDATQGEWLWSATPTPASPR